ncbi:thiol:disulfide interchange protein DsbA/DsbL [Lysobacter sp. H21R4]|uniref:thiol:disulfide interchange protein DsbA/DsbL n=1 Tax=Lysobacter sp. H21R4 TaxID=2781021 RepID=UPI0018875386|nr:thiol:disulfide interchange protein DsbA/DsbL [Lysobacter sp. H21R4]QOY62488.1 thiol:disulfide interchange protein DsbA/DsbL [Lysobacter sp. H21R4]
MKFCPTLPTSGRARFARLAATVLLAVVPLLACAAPPAPDALVAGTDYAVIPDGKPFETRPGKIEVVEVFGYTCPHCANFEPALQEWKQRQKPDVNVVSVPAPFGGYWIPYAQAFYAAQSMNLVERTHRDLFRAIHQEHRLPIGGATPQVIAKFYAGYGVDADDFAAAMTGKPVQEKLVAARDFLARSEVEGTPTLIVAGKYRVMGKSSDDVLRITDALVNRERAALVRQKK